MILESKYPYWGVNVSQCFIVNFLWQLFDASFTGYAHPKHLWWKFFCGQINIQITRYSLTRQFCSLCSEAEQLEEMEEEDSFSPPPSPVKPVERERIPSSHLRKRRTIYTAGTCTHTVLIKQYFPLYLTTSVGSQYAFLYI